MLGHWLLPYMFFSRATPTAARTRDRSGSRLPKCDEEKAARLYIFVLGVRPNELTVSRPTDETSLADLVRPLDLAEAEYPLKQNSMPMRMEI
jgi:hypothetical protein